MTNKQEENKFGYEQLNDMKEIIKYSKEIYRIFGKYPDSGESFVAKQKFEELLFWIEKYLYRISSTKELKDKEVSTSSTIIT